MARATKRRHWMLAFLLGSAIVGVTGVALITGNQLADTSYDLPFSSRLRTDIDVSELIIIYFDKAARDKLQQTNAA